MARTAGSDGEKTLAAIREAGARLMARRGYEAMSMRALAGEVGVQAAALYRYFPAKEDLLYALMETHMRELAASWAAARPANGSASASLAAFVGNHIHFHAARRHETHVSNMELRSLSPERLTAILRLRSAYEKELRLILHAGLQSGEFFFEDTRLTAMAVIQMITGVVTWFRPGERLSEDEVAAGYLAMTMRLVGARAAPERMGHERLFA